MPSRQTRFTSVSPETAVATPFSLKATVLSHGWHECAPMSWCEGGQCFQVIERLGDRPVRVSVTEGSKTRRTVRLRVLVEGDSLPDGAAEEMVGRVRVMLGLDSDLGEFYALCAEHPTLHVLPRIGAGRGLRSCDLAENIIKVQCFANVAWPQAVKMITRLCQLGPAMPHFVNQHAWPSAAEILRAGKEYLTGVCRVGYRAEWILAFCDNVRRGRFDAADLDRAALDGASTDDLVTRLRSIRGIGPTGANYLLSFLGRHERLAIDTSTVAHVARTYTAGRRPTNRQIEDIYAPYGRWKHLVWWFEHWLTWDTAKALLREGGGNRATDRH